MIYLDNGATTWPKPPAVLKELNRCFKYYAANPGRSGHDMAVKTADMVYECRNAVSDFFGMDSPERVIFTLNATHALNIAIKGSLRADSHVIITSMEHNSVLRPVCGLGIDYDIVEADEYGYVNPQDIESKIKSNTHLYAHWHQMYAALCSPLKKSSALQKNITYLFCLMLLRAPE